MARTRRAEDAISQATGQRDSGSTNKRALRSNNTSPQKIRSDAEQGEMGNEHSKQELHDQLVAASKQLKTAQNNVNSRVSTGTLGRPTRNNNPPYQNPTQVTAAGVQRNLGPVSGKRKSTYEFDESPEKLPAGHSAVKGGQAAFSPTRKTRSQVQVEQDDVSRLRKSPRKSKGQRGADVQGGAADETSRIDSFLGEMKVKKKKPEAKPAETITNDADEEIDEMGVADAKEGASDAAAGRRRNKVETGKRGRPRETGLAEYQEAKLKNFRKRVSGAKPRPSAEEQEDEEEEQGRQEADHPGSEYVDLSPAKFAAVKVVTDEYNTFPVSPEPALNKNKRKASGSQVPANTSSKRVRLVPSDLTSPEDESRWFGQYKVLKEVFEAVDLIGRPVEGKGEDRVVKTKIPFKLKDARVMSAFDACKDLVELYENLTHQTDEIAAQFDLSDPLVDVSVKVDRLCGIGVPFAKDNGTRCSNIYTHLVPSLLEVLQAALVCYETRDRNREDVLESQMSHEHLEEVNDIINITVRLVEQAKDYEARPPAKKHIVQPVRNDINAPLKKVQKAFTYAIALRKKDLNERLWREEYARQCALRLEQEECRSRQDAEIARWRTKWNKLHMERYAAEGSIPRDRPGDMKASHLAFPRYDIDHNGEPFERARLFHARVGPLPGMVEHAFRLEWTPDELAALVEGLEQYAGPLVIEKIMRRHCLVGRVLHRFNVTEIVTAAAMMKEAMLADFAERHAGEEVPAWVLGIPMWTKLHQAIGKENEEEEEDLEISEGGEEEDDVDDEDVDDLFVQ